MKTWDDKKDWISKRNELYRRIISSPYQSNESKELIQSYKQGIWETPKTFVDGYSYNDGSWIVFKTCRTTGGKFRNKILCNTKDDVIENLYCYLFFLKDIGINNILVMGYFCVCHIISKLTIRDKMWKPTLGNMNKIEELIKSVIKSTGHSNCSIDTRKYCMDPKMKKGKDVHQLTSIQRKKDKEIRWEKIEKLYDERKTNSENLKFFKENGLEISERTLQYWKKNRQGGVQNGF